MLFPPVIHNFRYKASVEHDNEYHIKRKLCTTGGDGGGGGGGGTASYKKKFKTIQSYKEMVDIKISIINICYANTVPIPKTLMVSLLHKWKNLIRMQKFKN